MFLGRIKVLRRYKIIKMLKFKTIWNGDLNMRVFSMMIRFKKI